jgi:hypothetical protein
MVALHCRATWAHQTFGLLTLGQPNLGYFPSYVIRTARGTHQGAPRVAGSPRDGGWLVSVFGSVGGEFQGLGAVGKWPKRCGVSSSSPTRGCRGPKGRWVVAWWAGQKLGFDLNLCEIRARGDSIYRAFWSPACTTKIRSSPYPESEFKLTFGYDLEENPRRGSFSFSSVGEGSRGMTTRLVGSR